MDKELEQLTIARIALSKAYCEDAGINNLVRCAIDDIDSAIMIHSINKIIGKDGTISSFSSMA